jgi:hypothetical protein
MNQYFKGYGKPVWLQPTQWQTHDNWTRRKYKLLKLVPTETAQIPHQADTPVGFTPPYIFFIISDVAVALEPRHERSKSE